MIGNGAKLEPPFIANTLPQSAWAHTHDMIDMAAAGLESNPEPRCLFADQAQAALAAPHKRW